MRPKNRTVRVFRALRPFLYKRWPLFLALGLSLFLGAAAILGQGLALRHVIGAFSAQDDGLVWSQMRTLVVPLSLAVLLAVSGGARAFLSAWLSEQVLCDIRQAAYDCLLRESPDFFSKRGAAEISGRLITDVAVLEAWFGTTGSMAIRNLLILVGGLCMLASTSLYLTCLTTIAIGVTLLPLLVGAPIVRRLARRRQTFLARLGGLAEERLSALRTLQTLTREDAESEVFAQSTQHLRRTATKLGWARAVLVGTLIPLAFATLGAVIALGYREIVEGRLGTEDLAAFIFYALLVMITAAALGDAAGEVQRGVGSMEEVVDILRKGNPVGSFEGAGTLRDAGGDARTSPDPRRRGKRKAIHLVVSDLSFCYANRPRVRVLQDVGFTLCAGEHVALVGPSGAGKSTLFDILLKFRAPRSGHVLLDGQDIRKMAAQELRRYIALVPQEVAIFSLTARENIRCAMPSASDEDVLQAAEIASARGFIEQLPQGFETFLGHKGAYLSYGQRQRIAIARAALRNPSLLLLDEATSALDSRNEEMIGRALSHLMRNRTTLSIAHRLTTVRRADRILVLERGRIVGRGTNEELLRNNAFYRTLAHSGRSKSGVRPQASSNRSDVGLRSSVAAEDGMSGTRWTAGTRK